MSSPAPFTSAVLSDSRLETFPMFVTEMGKLFIVRSEHDVHEIHSLLQPSNPLFSFVLLMVQKGLVMTSLIPDMIGGVVFQKKLLSHLVVLSDGGRGVVQMLFGVVGGRGLIRRGGNKGGSGSVERYSSEDGL
jgi:hypothetical protein